MHLMILQTCTTSGSEKFMLQNSEVVFGDRIGSEVHAPVVLAPDAQPVLDAEQSVIVATFGDTLAAHSPE
jgi:hypothetical protein